MLNLDSMKFYLTPDSFIDTSKPLDLSLPLTNSKENPSAWYVEEPVFEPVRTEHYIGSVKEGGSVNFRNIFFNPHGHGTHTECLGHITEEVYSINQTLKEYFFKAKVVSIIPAQVLNKDGAMDNIIEPKHLDFLENIVNLDALIIRTLPNLDSKKSKNYSNSNPAYMDVTCAEQIIKSGIDHLLIDTPSVDRESDEGQLAFHHAFWEVPNNPNFSRTISELIFVNDSIEDGDYILNFQVAPFENDASPSRPVLYQIEKA